MHLAGYPLILLLLFCAATMPFVLMLLSQCLQFKMPTAMKYTSYESGMVPYGDAHVRFDVKFYLYALLFILFDIETIFLFPWAMSFGQLGMFAMVEMIVFIGILLLGLVYAWRKGALRWQ